MKKKNPLSFDSGKIVKSYFVKRIQYNLICIYVNNEFLVFAYFFSTFYT